MSAYPPPPHFKEKQMIKKGDMVFYNDGANTWPAIVTQVWSNDCVNLFVLVDHAPQTVTSSMRDAESSGSVAGNCWREGPFID